MDLDYLAVSDGNGDAALMHIMTDRNAGATILDVDTVVNVPLKFIGTAGTLLPTGLIDPATKMDFKGSVSNTGDIIIDDIEPGSHDEGNTHGQVVLIKPNTPWANLVAAALKDMKNSLYPVGCIYTETTGTNPATTLGVGTWLPFAAGKTLIGNGISDRSFSAGDTGGESNHTLTAAEMPMHGHGINDPGHSHAVPLTGSNNEVVTNNRSIEWSDAVDAITVGTTASGSNISIQNAGGGQPHNNLPPFVVVYFWRRTA